MTDLRPLHGRLVLLKSRHDHHNPPTGMRGTIEVRESPGLEPQVNLVIDFPQMFTTQARRRVLTLSEAQISELLRSETTGTFEFTIDDDLELSQRFVRMSELPDCLYCRKDQRLKDLMIEVASMSVSTLYLFREQTHRGRCVVAYRSHVNELYELPDTELTMFMRDVARAAKAIKHAFGPSKINYGAYSDKLPHLHMHLVPKYEGGAAWGAPFEMMPANKQLLSEAEYVTIISKIKAML